MPSARKAGRPIAHPLAPCVLQADYQKLLAQRQKEQRDKKMEKISQRKSARSSRASEE